MKKQSRISKILTAILCLIFHSRYEKSSTRSTTLAKNANNKKSHYNPVSCSILKKDFKAFSIETTVPKKIKSSKIIFHIHGGSFKMRLTDFYRKQAVFYSKLFDNCIVHSVDYRVYPDVEFPVPLEDVYSSYLYLIKSGINPENIIVVGDSCGSNMAASLCLKLKDNCKPLPKNLILFSFWGDMTNSGSSYRDNCYRDPFYGIPKKLSFEECESRLKRITIYAQGQDLYNPYLSPCFGDFSDFPETVLVTGSADISQSDSITAYEKLCKEGISVHLLSYENMFHDFQFVKFLPESKDVFRKIKQIEKQP